MIPPLVLYVKGKSPQDVGYSLAVVGLRRPTCGKKLSYGIAHAWPRNGLKVFRGGADDIGTYAY